MAAAKVKPFAIEQWMDKYETSARFNVAETCAASISLEDLKDLSEDKKTEVWTPSTKLTYGAIRGSQLLRSNLAELYSTKSNTRFTSDDIVITPGAIAANMITLYALVGKGDHVICHYPTYQQLYEIPASLGAEVDLWRAKESEKWQLDIEELKKLIRPNTKLIIINNPQNPTGAIIPKQTLEAIVAIAQAKNIIIHSDEVYRPLFHSIDPSDADFPPSTLNVLAPSSPSSPSSSYTQIIATGSLSKAYSLAGIRVGWIASRSASLIEACVQARDYTTISVSQIDDSIAAYALGQSCVHALLARNIRLARRNLHLLESFIDEHRWACEWVKPVAGSTAFVKFSIMGDPVDDAVFCASLIEQTGVMVAPGSKCFGDGVDFKGYVRFGFCCETEVLLQALDRMRVFMKVGFKKIPVAQ